MKSKILFALSVILTISLLFSCSDDEIVKVLPKANSNLKDYNLKLDKKVNLNTIGISAFAPLGSFVSNGKIYVTNYSQNRVEVLDQKTGKPLGFIKDWTFNGNDYSLYHPMDVCVSNGRIYVACHGLFKVNVFDQKTLAFISCIGNGTYSGSTAIDDPYAVRVSGNKVFVLDMNAWGVVRVFNSEEVTPENYEKMVPRATLSLDLPAEQWDSSYSMECSGNQLYVADVINKRILVFEIGSMDLSNSELSSKTIKPTTVIKFNDEIAVPTGLTIFKDYILVSCANVSRIDALNKQDGTLISSFKTIGDATLKRPDRIFAKNDTIYVSDAGNSAFYISTMNESLVKEFE